jgi:hypothetical protein
MNDEELLEIKAINPKETNWLFVVENRSVLRKIVRHLHIPNKEKIAFIAFDGQIRNTQYNFISLWKTANVENILVWSDYDEYAIAMLNKINTIGFPNIKVLLSDKTTLRISSYNEAVNELCKLKKSKHLVEQEFWLKDMVKISEILEGLE